MTADDNLRRAAHTAYSHDNGKHVGMGCTPTDHMLDLAHAALAARSEPCGWDTRRGDGPLGGPCVLPAGHDGPHAARSEPPAEGTAVPRRCIACDWNGTVGAEAHRQLIHPDRDDLTVIEQMGEEYIVRRSTPPAEGLPKRSRDAILALGDLLREEHGESHDCPTCLAVQAAVDNALAVRSEPRAEGLREHGEHDNRHHYRLECEVCGQPGSVNVIIQPDYVRDAATPPAEGLDVHDIERARLMGMLDCEKIRAAAVWYLDCPMAEEADAEAALRAALAPEQPE